MNTTPAYEMQAVAQAVDVPVRRLEGWVERRVVRPTQPAGGTGRRARFSREDVLRVAILVEVQRLLGFDFRPGGLGTQLGSAPLTWAHLETVFRRIVGDAEPDEDRREAPVTSEAKLLLYVYLDAKGRRSLGVTRKPLDQLVGSTSVLLAINPGQLWQRVRLRLEADVARR